MPVPEASTALARFTVLDLTRVRAGPTAVRQLADWGANVIKIELPEHLDAGEALGGARHGPDFQNLHRNKRGITLDLKSPRAPPCFRRLAAKADVVVENFRPDVKTRLGIDYAALSKLNPRLVYASISGFGQDGPYREAPGRRPDRPGHGRADVDHRRARAAGRCASASRSPTCRPASSARSGILVALLEREQSGKGQEVATSLLQAQIFMLDFQAARWLNDGRGAAARPATTIRPASRPASSRRATATSTSPPPAARCGSGSARRSAPPALLDNPSYATAAARLQNRDALNAAIEQLSGRPHQRRVGRAAERGRRAVRADHTPSTRCSPTRRSQHLGVVQDVETRRRARHAARARPAGDAGAHAEPRSSRRRPSAASTPTRCWASSASAKPRSRACARRR